MRGMIGLLAVLIGVGLILFLIAGPLGKGGQSYIGATMQKRQQAMTQTYSFGGMDAQGVPVHQTLTLAPGPGTFRSVTVTGIDPAGAAAVRWGLQPGDEIYQIGPHDVGGYIVTDMEAVNVFLMDAYARGQNLYVRRNGEELELRPGQVPGGMIVPGLPAGGAVPASPAASSGNGGGGTNARSQARDVIDQLQGINGANSPGE